MSDSKFTDYTPGDDALPADALTHSLLEQAAANRKGDDEDLLDRVEAAIDADSGVAIPIPIAKAAPRPWKTIVRSAAVAAVIISAGLFWLVNYHLKGASLVPVGLTVSTANTDTLSDDISGRKMSKWTQQQGPVKVPALSGPIEELEGTDASGLYDLNFEIADTSSIEKIKIDGNSLTRDRVIRREMPTAPGKSVPTSPQSDESYSIAGTESSGGFQSKGVSAGDVVVKSTNSDFVFADRKSGSEVPEEIRKTQPFSNLFSEKKNGDAGAIDQSGNWGDITLEAGGVITLSESAQRQVGKGLDGEEEAANRNKSFAMIGHGGRLKDLTSGKVPDGPVDSLSTKTSSESRSRVLNSSLSRKAQVDAKTGGVFVSENEPADGVDGEMLAKKRIPTRRPIVLSSGGNSSVGQAGGGGADATKKPQAITYSATGVSQPLASYTGSGSVDAEMRRGPTNESKVSGNQSGYSAFGRTAREGGSRGGEALDGRVRLSVGYGVTGGVPAIKSKSTRYNELIDNEWMSPREEPLSTFSSDVDTASWTNLRGMIRSGLSIGQIPNDAVRIEEMINYFDWEYSKPKGDHPFSFATETASCPWNADHQLLRVGVQGMEISKKKRPNSNLVFLIDVSGSMDRSNKLGLVKKSIMVLAEELRETDCVSMVVYAGAEGLALPATSGRDTAAIANALTRLNAGGSTNGGAGIKLAYQMAKENFIEGGVNRVILCTDGDFNVGITGNESLVKMVESRAKDGVFLSVLGYGNDNLNDSMLEEITNKGNGNYFFIDSLAEARKVLLRDLMGTLVTIAKDVKIQIEFNPAKVDGYRLIGYANRKLKAEDFANDKVDAGEVGSGHSVTAIYEIIPAGVGMKGVDDLRYQKASKPKQELELVESKELALLKLRYKRPDSDVSTPIEQVIVPVDTKWEKATGDFRFASAVSLFGLILRDHESASEASLDDVVRLAESGKGNDPLGYRSEFIDLVKILKAAKN